MNSNDGDSSRGNKLFRWYAHPLTTVLVLVCSIPLLDYYLESGGLVATAFCAMASFVTACAGQDAPPVD
ncbi:hypothetical protein EEB12_28290 [Rhodococcus sp. WS1]|uniref:hypothetical protein n=1 Tax=Rhodococcus TaxID=1827 RepID=UPI001143DA1F|nr:MULTISPECIES: hypothetical protein [unclassified Rhodococcus (in: high G+C Gram-positive bacteria)]ROZ52760.1 hypothetical protein EEB12_28290 [Rhodococcus sp. WS1]TQC34283.1 hypothetical protein EEB16_29280 [Rhodococcus sp. WS7]